MAMDIPKTRALCDVLIEMGFAVAVDDFGSGFSSFTMLKDLPLSQIKIDRAFVEHCLSDEQSQIILETTLFMAKKMGLQVIAVGVNNDRIADHLCGLNCHYLQGFNVSAALPLNECISWVDSNRLVKSELKKY
jgi:EAL domain-containing protein (putative c-di-GMP-specific phosphodiesterase class I)